MTPSIKDLQEYLARFGRRGASVVDVLLKNTEHLDAAWGSEFAKAVLKDDMDRLTFLMQKAYRENLPDDERAELKYLTIRVGNLANRFHTVQKAEQAIMKSLKSQEVGR